MKIVKKTAEYTIYQRGDSRYAVENAAKMAVNGDDKVAILVAEGLLTVKVAAPTPVAEEVAAEDAGEEAAAAE